MVVPAFGFSFGDFAGAVKLVGKAAKALREATGATAQYQQAAIELDNVYSVLRGVQSSQPTTPNADVVQKIQLCALTCQVPLARFLKKIEKFEQHLGTNSSCSRNANAMKRIPKSGRKIQWAVDVEDQLAKLKGSIAPELATIQILLQLEALERISESQDTATETHTQVEGLVATLHDLKTFIRSEVATRDQVGTLHPLLENLTVRTTTDNDELREKLLTQEDLLQCILQKVSCTPPSGAVSLRTMYNQDASRSSDQLAGPMSGALDRLSSVATRLHPVFLAIRKGLAEMVIVLICLFPAIQRFLRSVTAMARSPTLFLQDNIYLEDALGRVMSLPYEHFRYWNVFQARLQEAFTGVPGEARVKKHQFHIMTMQTAGRMVLTRKDWSYAVLPGSKLVMSMLFINMNFGVTECPRCHWVNSVAKGNPWVK